MTTQAPKKFPLLPVLIGIGVIALIATVILTMDTAGVSEEGEFGTPQRRSRLRTQPGDSALGKSK